MEIGEVLQIYKLITLYIMSIVDPGNNHQKMLKILRQKLIRKFTIDGSGWQHLNPGIDLNILKKETDIVCHMIGCNRKYTTPSMEIFSYQKNKAYIASNLCFQLPVYRN